MKTELFYFVTISIKTYQSEEKVTAGRSESALCSVHFIINRESDLNIQPYCVDLYHIMLAPQIFRLEQTIKCVRVVVTTI